MATRQMRTGQERVMLEELVQAIGAAVPKLDATEQRIAVQVYRLLAERGPVSSDDLARATELSRDRVEAALDSWPGVFRDKAERVVGFWGADERQARSGVPLADR